ncbi:MAG TPA: PilZ domain-containing protein [Phycisphaerales bacterium]|nr:PilZ domain-containing protein [Phycisphaerales bacterium]
MPTAENQLDRRQYERFALLPMYTRVALRFQDRESFDYEGHCYDISEGGLCFELDRPIEPGTPVILQIDLPLDEHGQPPADARDRSVYVESKVVWLDQDECAAGPARMAAVFTRFSRFGDKERLIGQFCSGRFARAA